VAWAHTRPEGTLAAASFRMMELTRSTFTMASGLHYISITDKNRLRFPLRIIRTTMFIRGRWFGAGGDSPMVQGYCVKCRAKREISNAVAVKLKNGKPAMKGKCPVCGTTIMRIGAAK
jgi:hypothetical protein